MVAQKRSVGILFWTFIVSPVVARARLRMNISSRESKQAYFHQAPFLADSYFLDLKPILLILWTFANSGRNSDCRRIPAHRVSAPCDASFAALTSRPHPSSPRGLYHGRRPSYQKRTKGEIKTLEPSNKAVARCSGCGPAVAFPKDTEPLGGNMGGEVAEGLKDGVGIEVRTRTSVWRRSPPKLSIARSSCRYDYSP